MKKIFLITVLNTILITAYSQVGIGNVSPDNNSILDLSNTNNRGLLLPKSSSIYPTTPSGLLFFNENDSIVYYNQGGSYNGLSPWKYKFGGSVSENTFYSKSGNVGIGSESPQKKLHVTDNGEVIIIEGTNHSYFGLYNTGYNNGRGASFGFITASTTIVTLKNEILNGDIDLTTAGSGEVTVPNGDVDIQDGKVKEYGNELLPRGAIILWSGTTAPAGWALCDGGSYPREDGGGNVTVPNLRGRFVVGYNSSDADYNAIGDNGGVKEVTLNSTQVPNHSHTGTALSAGSHTHSFNDILRSTSNLCASTGCSNNTGDSGTTTTTNTTFSGGAHTHSLSINSTSGGGNAHENRPPYYTLAYIYKL